MIRRALIITAIRQNPAEEAEESRRDVQIKVRARKKLKRKLLLVFAMTLLANVVNAIFYISGSTLIPHLWHDMSLLSGCGILVYSVINLHLLDMLKEGVLGKNQSVTQLSSVHQLSAINENNS